MSGDLNGRLSLPSSRGRACNNLGEVINFLNIEISGLYLSSSEILLLFGALVFLLDNMKFVGSLARPPTIGPDKIPTYPCQLDDRLGWSYGEQVFSKIFVDKTDFVLTLLPENNFAPFVQGVMKGRKQETLSVRPTLDFMQNTIFPRRRNRALCSRYAFTSLAGMATQCR